MRKWNANTPPTVQEAVRELTVLFQHERLEAELQPDRPVTSSSRGRARILLFNLVPAPAFQAPSALPVSVRSCSSSWSSDGVLLRPSHAHRTPTETLTMSLITAGRLCARILGAKNSPCVLIAARQASSSTNLKDVLSDLIPKEQTRIKNFKQQYGNTVIGQITVDMVYGGMRGMKGLVYETSVLDPDEVRMGPHFAWTFPLYSYIFTVVSSSHNTMRSLLVSSIEVKSGMRAESLW
ncbi:PREDICTED: uncharacterized protein LOC108796491, partial [Nanorana parkeri]|uniref:uncharacterized protein LOC108796491 n=1 Tax=Nanorana parkeri TaxID=125878 RepID=UPI000853F177